MARLKKAGCRIRDRLLVICGMALLAGCGVSPSQQQGGAQGRERGATDKMEEGRQAEQPPPVVRSDAGIQTSPLEGVLRVLLSAGQVDWQAFDAIPGVHWKDAAPQDNPDATGPADARYRSGDLVLSGFGQVPVPDGQQGADAGAKDDDEGHSGLTLTGDKAHVLTAAVQKFYATDDYQAVLRRQLGADAQLKVIAETCGGDDPGEADPLNTRFYAVTLKSGVVYVEAYSDDGAQSHGPGSTTFVFTKAKPEQRIASLGCKEKAGQ